VGDGADRELLGAGWTSRDDAAAALDIPRSVASVHLDKLVAAGVLEVRFERTSGRSGPGAGRPSKLYRAAPGEISASVRPRRHRHPARTHRSPPTHARRMLRPDRRHRRRLSNLVDVGHPARQDRSPRAAAAV